MIPIIDIIKKSFKAWSSNFIIILPFVFMILSVIALALPFVLFLFLNSSKLSQTQSLLSLNWAWILICILFFIIAAIFISSYFSAGSIGMAKEIQKGKKTSLKTMHNTGKHFLLRYIGLIILVGLISLFLIFVFIVLPLIPIIMTKNYWLLFIPLIGIIALILFLLFFSLSRYYLVINDIGVIESIKKSFSIVKKNYLSLLGLVALFMLIQFVLNIIGFIPIIGGLIGQVASILIISPVSILAYTLFAMDREKKPKNLKRKNFK